MTNTTNTALTRTYARICDIHALIAEIHRFPVRDITLMAQRLYPTANITARTCANKSAWVIFLASRIVQHAACMVLKAYQTRAYTHADLPDMHLRGMRQVLHSIHVFRPTQFHRYTKIDITHADLETLDPRDPAVAWVVKPLVFDHDSLSYIIPAPSDTLTGMRHTPVARGTIMDPQTECWYGVFDFSRAHIRTVGALDIVSFHVHTVDATGQRVGTCRAKIRADYAQRITAQVTSGTIDPTQPLLIHGQQSHDAKSNHYIHIRDVVAL